MSAAEQLEQIHANWPSLDEDARALLALAVHGFSHRCVFHDELLSRLQAAQEGAVGLFLAWARTCGLWDCYQDDLAARR